MRRHWAIASVLWIVLAGSAACSPLPSLARPTEATEANPTIAVPATATQDSLQSTTPTPGPFALELTPFPTATALPALVLPTQPAFPQELQVWDGLPTYPAESRSDLYFRLLYDPASWARTTDPFGSPALASRSIPGCVLTPSIGRGMPLSGSADHDVRQIGTTTFEISVVSVNDVIQFVNYTGGDGAILTAFELNFAEEGDPCRSEAEQVLGTLRSVAAIEATPPRRP